MVAIEIRYLGDLRCEAVHAPSGAHLVTDAPLDNEGRGESFSPTDLVATALGTCLLTIFGIVARRHGIDPGEVRVRVEKHMASQAPRRIGRLVVRIRVPLPPDHPQRALLEKAALSCPVHWSLHPELEQDVAFEWVG